VSLDDEIGDVDENEDLETLNIRGFAPFFSRIDLSAQKTTLAKVSVYETVQPSILDDANNIVRQSFAQMNFTASSVVTVTFENVSTTNEKYATQV